MWDKPQVFSSGINRRFFHQSVKWRLISDALKSSRFWGRLSSMLQINVALPNGHAELLTLLPSSTVQDLKTAAQRALGKKHLRLFTAKNQVLVDFGQTLEEAEIEDGECLTALVLQPQLAATHGAFALWCRGDSAIVTWRRCSTVVVTVREFKISSGVCSRFKPRVILEPLLRFWQMDPSLHGVKQTLWR